MTDDGKKRGLTVWEKIAIVIIVILALIILALIFREELEEYLKLFLDWYRSKG